MLNRQLARRLMIGLFLAALWTPFLGMVIVRKRPDGPNFTTYFHDHFGLRGSLIILQALIKVKVLGVSSSSEVVVGKNGWLYFTGDYSLDNYRGLCPFRPEELAQWVRLFQARQNWLEGRGIAFAVVVAPDKQTIYPENLPESIGPRGRTTRLDQLATALRQNTNVKIIDLRAALIAAKAASPHPLYYLTDSHWNGYGGLIAYQQIARDIPGLQPISRPECVDSEVTSSGDLAMMLGLRREIHERMFSCNILPAPERNPAARGSLLLYHDSFGGALMPFLSRNFNRTVYSPADALDPALVETERPTLLIAELVERRLNKEPPADPKF